MSSYWRLLRSSHRSRWRVVDDPAEMVLPRSQFNQSASGGPVRGGTVLSWHSPRGWPRGSRVLSPPALGPLRGDRACFVGKEPREAGGLARPFGLMPREKVSRGGAGVRQYLAAFSPVKGPSRGKGPREARQALRAWSLAESEAASVMASRGEVPRQNEIAILAFSNFLGDFVFPHFEDVGTSCLHIDLAFVFHSIYLCCANGVMNKFGHVIND